MASQTARPVAAKSWGAGASGSVGCVVVGGMPAPRVALEIDGFNKTKIVSSDQTQEMNDDGVYVTEQAS